MHDHCRQAVLTRVANLNPGIMARIITATFAGLLPKHFRAPLR